MRRILLVLSWAFLLFFSILWVRSYQTCDDFGYHFKDGVILRMTAVIGPIGVVLASLATVGGVAVFNVMARLFGGVEVTVSDVD